MSQAKIQKKVAAPSNRETGPHLFAQPRAEALRSRKIAGIFSGLRPRFASPHLKANPRSPRMRFVSILLALAVGASATIIRDNGTPSYTDGERSDFDSGKQIGDQFTLLTGATLQAIQWWGIYGFGNTPQSVDLFTVQIFAITSGSPAATPLIQYSLSGVSRQLTGGSVGPFPVYVYDKVIPDTTLGPGTYLFSVMNDTTADTDDSWYWADSTLSTHAAWERNSAAESWYNTRGAFPSTPTPSVAFKISGTSIPEPAAWSLFAVTGACFGFFRRYRKVLATPRGGLSKC
jgi:hypothetical protein